MSGVRVEAKAGGGGAQSRGGGTHRPSPARDALQSAAAALLHPPLHCLAADELCRLYDQSHRILTAVTAPATAQSPASLRCSPYHLRLLLLGHRSLHAYAQREGVFARRSEAAKQSGCSDDLLAYIEHAHQQMDAEESGSRQLDGGHPLAD